MILFSDELVQIGTRCIYEDDLGFVTLQMKTVPFGSKNSDHLVGMSQCDVTYNGIDGCTFKINLKKVLRSCIRRVNISLLLQ